MAFEKEKDIVTCDIRENFYNRLPWRNVYCKGEKAKRS